VTTGVVVMAYGTPATPADVEAYYTHIRRGRPPETAQLAELAGRYEAIGGTSPLAERTRAQVRAIEADLEHDAPGELVVRLGQKHAAPFIEDAVGELVTEGVERIVGLVLAPHYSAASVGQYHDRAREAAGAVPFTGIDSWHLLPELVELQASRLRQRLVTLPHRTVVLFTAHSLPERVLAGDPYPDQLQEAAEAVAGAAGLDDGGSWRLAWQSAGRTPEPWRGPDILEVIAELGSSPGCDGLLAVPQGFTSDHLEVLYDLDIEAAGAASAAGIAFARTEVVNDDPAVMQALARLVRRTARG
jgi:ferrochelatase